MRVFWILWKAIKSLLKWSLFLLLAVVLGVILFVNLSPQFGGAPSEDDIQFFEQESNYQDGTFHNLVPTSRGFSWKTFKETLYDYYKGNLNREPQKEIPVIKQTAKEIDQPNQVVWFGHSAFYVQINGKSILIDPMLTETPSPVSFLSKSRYSNSLPIEITDLPEIDFVFISHDHYDHLDYESIKALQSKTKKYVVPLGVDAHLKEWGVPDSNIHRFNWWEKNEIDGLEIVFTPSRHFSGRGITDHNATLWGSWIIKDESHNLFFSGDGGYGDHFKEIGKKYGPFDFAMLECGQYNSRWKDIHMLPEETAQAGVDVKAKVAMPIHWGAFTLSIHDWFEPPERMLKKANDLNLNVITPMIGEIIYLDSLSNYLSVNWWEKCR